MFARRFAVDQHWRLESSTAVVVFSSFWDRVELDSLGKVWSSPQRRSVPLGERIVGLASLEDANPREGERI